MFYHIICLSDIILGTLGCLAINSGLIAGLLYSVKSMGEIISSKLQ